MHVTKYCSQINIKHQGECTCSAWPVVFVSGWQTYMGPWITLASVSCWQINRWLHEEPVHFQNRWQAINPNFSMATGHDQFVISSLLWFHQLLIRDHLPNNLSLLNHDYGGEKISQWFSAVWQHERFHRFQHRWPACSWQAWIFM